MSALAVHRAEPYDPYAAARQVFDETVARLRTEEAQQMTHSDMERELEERGREMLRQLMQGWLEEQAEATPEGEVVDADGQQRTRTRDHERHLKTVFGEVTVERVGYPAEGKSSLHPLDGQLNLPPELYSHELRRRVAEEASKSSFDETVATIQAYTGSDIPKRQVEQLAQRAAQDFDVFYETRRREAPETGEESGSLLVLTCDAKGVVMVNDDLRPETRKKAEAQHRKLTTRLSKGEKPHRKRMATVTAVYTVAPFERSPEEVFAGLARRPTAEPRKRPRPEAKQVAASLVDSPQAMLEAAFQEGLRRDPQRTKRWVAVVDGNETQLDALRKLARKHGIQLTIVLDIIHVLEYLWKAGRVFHAESSEELEAWVLERLRRILQGHAGQVAGGMRRSATKRKLPEHKCKPVKTCAGYLLKPKHTRCLDYPAYLAAGMPIGTGVIEGTVRHLVLDRMGLTGARWRLPSAEAVLRLRALRANGDFDQYWHFHEAREHERNHQVQYQDSVVPLLRSPRHRKPDLKVTKGRQ